MPQLLLPTFSLWQREVVRFFRQRSRIFGAIGTPLLFWLLIGKGLGSSFQQAGDPASFGYLEYFFPGIVVLMVLFTAIFSTISIIEDKKQGFLQSVLVAPISRLSIVLAKVFGGTTIALLQAMLFFLVAPWLGIPLQLENFFLAITMLIIIGFGLTALGFIIAWNMDSIQGFHAIMNLLLIPLWLLSGGVFPATGAASWIRYLMAVNPVTYGVAALRQILYDTVPQNLPHLSTCFMVVGGFTTLMLLFSFILVSRPAKGN